MQRREARQQADVTSALYARPAEPDPTWLRASLPAMWSGGSHEVALAEIHAVVAHNVVGGRDVEIEVRQRAVLQQVHAFELLFPGRRLDRETLALGAVHLPRVDRL